MLFHLFSVYCNSRVTLSSNSTQSSQLHPCSPPAAVISAAKLCNLQLCSVLRKLPSLLLELVMIRANKSAQHRLSKPEPGGKEEGVWREGESIQISQLIGVSRP